MTLTLGTFGGDGVTTTGSDSPFSFAQCEEDQLGALGLVVNTMVLWNTFYMHQARADTRERNVSGACAPLGSWQLTSLDENQP